MQFLLLKGNLYKVFKKKLLLIYKSEKPIKMMASDPPVETQGEIFLKYFISQRVFNI